MFIKNANKRHHIPHPELFLPSRPYKGEPPTEAGFLLYPDTPAKMETTSQEAFCFRPVPQQGRGNVLQPHLNPQRDRVDQNLQREARPSHPAFGDHVQTMLAAVKNEQDSTEMQSQYQKDFPPPSSCRRRRTPALPQPDNIGINPAFRIEFRTAQREAYPGWPVVDPGCVARLRAALSKESNRTSE